MSNEIWLVVEAHGDYSDHTERVVSWYPTCQEAESAKAALADSWLKLKRKFQPLIDAADSRLEERRNQVEEEKGCAAIHQDSGFLTLLEERNKIIDEVRNPLDPDVTGWFLNNVKDPEADDDRCFDEAQFYVQKVERGILPGY